MEGTELAYILCAGRNIALLSTLHGTLIAHSVQNDLEESEPSSRHMVRVNELWTRKLQSPVLSSPTVDLGAGLFIVASIDGLVTGISSEGEQLSLSNHL